VRTGGLLHTWVSSQPTPATVAQPYLESTTPNRHNRSGYHVPVTTTSPPPVHIFPRLPSPSPPPTPLAPTHIWRRRPSTHCRWTSSTSYPLPAARSTSLVAAVAAPPMANRPGLLRAGSTSPHAGPRSRQPTSHVPSLIILLTPVFPPQAAPPLQRRRLPPTTPTAPRPRSLRRWPLWRLSSSLVQPLKTSSAGTTPSRRAPRFDA